MRRPWCFLRLVARGELAGAVLEDFALELGEVATELGGGELGESVEVLGRVARRVVVAEAAGRGLRARLTTRAGRAHQSLEKVSRSLRGKTTRREEKKTTTGTTPLA